MVDYDELKTRYSSVDSEEYRREYARAGLDGEIVELFHAVRTTANLSYGELAERMGRSAEAVEELENFETTPTLHDLAELSRATGISLRLIAVDTAEIELGADRTPDTS